jgi:hypothetical protein
VFIRVNPRVWFPQGQPGHFSSYLLSSRYVVVKLLLLYGKKNRNEGNPRGVSEAYCNKIISAVYIVVDGYASAGPVKITKILDCLSNYWLLKKVSVHEVSYTHVLTNDEDFLLT